MDITTSSKKRGVLYAHDSIAFFVILSLCTASAAMFFVGWYSIAIIEFETVVLERNSFLPFAMLINSFEGYIEIIQEIMLGTTNDIAIGYSSWWVNLSGSGMIWIALGVAVAFLLKIVTCVKLCRNMAFNSFYRRNAYKWAGFAGVFSAIAVSVFIWLAPVRIPSSSWEMSIHFPVYVILGLSIAYSAAARFILRKVPVIPTLNSD